MPARQAARELKLGPGGLRDIEFAVQLLQLVHGRSDEALRAGNTLLALGELTSGGYVAREDGAILAEAYRFLRTLEHRLQLSRLRRTHVVPTDAAALRVLGRSMGMTSEPDVELTQEWNRHVREVRRLHERLFYRPLLEAVASVSVSETATHDHGRPSAPRGARLPRPGCRPSPPRGVVIGSITQSGDPASSAARDAGLVRRGPRPRQRPAGVPAAERRRRVVALVPRHVA
ncbi:MAG: hypothetical protein WKF76_02550 [Nocardioidaceae bacterium]